MEGRKVVFFLVVKSHGRKEGCDFFRCEVQWKEVRCFFWGGVKSPGRKEGCYFLGVKSCGKEGRLVVKYYSELGGRKVLFNNCFFKN